jgi:toxin FitB
MKFLVDVDVLSEATKPDPSPKVIAWLRKHEAEVAIDSLILGEIKLGILLLPAGKRRSSLEAWFDRRIDRLVCLPWGPESALEWAALMARLRKKGAAMPLLDSMIAATALRHGLTVVTRNVADFAKSGLRVVNPFE